MTIEFKPLNKEHLPLLLKWLNSPHVQEYWDPGVLWTDELVLQKYEPYIEGYKLIDGIKLPIEAYIIESDSIPVGYIQTYDASLFPREGYKLEGLITDTKSKFAALDIFLGELTALGKGLGSAAITQFLTTHVWPRFEKCIVDPDKHNPAAIHAYERAGFVKIKDTPDGKGILMIAMLNSPSNKFSAESGKD